jgi:hypothetical protein
MTQNINVVGLYVRDQDEARWRFTASWASWSIPT